MPRLQTWFRHAQPPHWGNNPNRRAQPMRRMLADARPYSKFLRLADRADQAARTFAAAQLLQHSLVAQRELAGLHHQLNARVNTLARLLLLRLRRRAERRQTPGQRRSRSKLRGRALVAVATILSGVWDLRQKASPK